MKFFLYSVFTSKTIHSKKNSKNVDFSLWGNSHAKMELFPRFSSLCTTIFLLQFSIFKSNVHLYKNKQLHFKKNWILLWYYCDFKFFFFMFTTTFNKTASSFCKQIWQIEQAEAEQQPFQGNFLLPHYTKSIWIRDKAIKLYYIKSYLLNRIIGSITMLVILS